MQPKLTRLSVSLTVILFVTLIILIIGEMYLFRSILLRNAWEMGMTQTQSYAAECKSHFSVFKTLIEYSASEVESAIAAPHNTKDIAQKTQLLFERVRDVVGDHKVSPYAIVDNTVFTCGGAQTPLANFAPARRPWFAQASQSPGKTIFTGLYQDPVRGEHIFSAAYKVPHANIIIALEVVPGNFFARLQIPCNENMHSLFLCDATGAIICSRTPHKEEHAVIQAHVRNILDRIRKGELNSSDDYIVDPGGELRTVCHAETGNGWYIIHTIPHLEILEEATFLFFFFVALLFVASIFVGLHAWRTLRIARLMERSNETVRVLAQSYLALYRVNLKDNTYEIIKTDTELEHHIPPQGSYGNLMQVMLEGIESDARHEYAHNFSCEHLRTLMQQRVKTFGGEFRRRFGEKYRWVSAQVLFDKTLFPEVVLCFHEEEQRRQRQLQESRLLQNALEDMQQSEKAKQAFFNNMSHDMRTPTNAIIGMSYLAKMSLDDKQKLSTYLDRIFFSGHQLKNLIDDILNLSHIEHGKFPLNNKHFDLKQCIYDCLATYFIEAEQENKQLILDIQLNELWVIGDSVRIVQLLNNLLSNAFKFTSAGQSIRVSVTQTLQNDMVACRIIVEDTGMGMSEKFIPTLFAPYSRETRFSEKNISGNGLGMSIVKILVESMNGDIAVKSALGKGTTFTIILPFRLAKELPAQPAKNDNSPVNLDVLRGKHILLAEDNMINMDLATEMLTMNGMEVTKAWNGCEAVERFQESEPFFFQAILLDMKMPKMDGCEAARRIRQLDRPDAQTVPIIAVTANAFAEDQTAVRMAGMNMHVAKPINFPYLFHVLANFFQKR